MGGCCCFERRCAVAAKRHIRDFQDSCHDKKRIDPGSVADAFELAIELVNMEKPADAHSSPELVSMKNALGTARVEQMGIHDELALLQ